MWPFQRRVTDKTWVEIKPPQLGRAQSCKVSINGGPWSEHVGQSWYHEGKEIVGIKCVDNDRYRVALEVKVFIQERRRSTPDANERKPPMPIG